jgi:hypothetical protein
MNDNSGIPNQAFHNAVTGTTFVLTLAASHIKWLHRVATNYKSGFPRTERCDQAVGLQGLIRRGLVDHSREPFDGQKDIRKRTLNSHFRLTKAGWLALDLLAEAGLVDAVDRRSPLRRKAA